MNTNLISKHMKTYREVRNQYPSLSKAAEIMPPPPAEILGRDINELRRGLRNPEKANVALLAEPGTGKTAYVQGFAYDKESLPYYLVLEVNPERLIEKTGDRDNALLTGFNELLDEAGKYSKDHNVIVVLFIDEFHKMMAISPSLMESLKPRLEKSALHGFRLIAATTFQEYNETIAKNRALDQRFLQIKLSELPKDAVLHVLENRAKQHGVYEHLDKGVLDDIYIESKRILMSNAQPRASIDILNSMIGDTVKNEHMERGKLVKEFYTSEELGFATEKVISRPLLKRIIKRAHGIDIDNTVDVKNVINALKTRLFNQDHAIEIVVHLLEMAAQGFSDISRPKFSFLSTGTTGTGKALLDDELIPAPVEGGYIRNGNLKPGDLVYSRHGKPIRVTGVYPQGLRTVYRVTLTDGRTINCARDHLWVYYKQPDYLPEHRKSAGDEITDWKIATTEELMAKQLERKTPDGRVIYDFLIPQNEAIERDPADYEVLPATFGMYLSNPDIMRQIDPTIEQAVPELFNTDASRLYIPSLYKLGSVDQRWDLIDGIFRNNSYIDSEESTVCHKTVSEQIAYDIQEILWSLGSMSFITSANGSYIVHVKMHDLSKWSDSLDFFTSCIGTGFMKKVCRSCTAIIKSIEQLPYKARMTCIMVDDPEHLYLAGKGHIVTHNTEMAKIISETMMLPLKRFDMSRYSDPKMAKEFADALFQAAWSTPNAYLLVDEVEKSSREAMNILLQVLDDARLTDSANPDRVASFSGCIINLTTNLGSEVYQNMQKFQNKSAEADAELVYKALCNAEVFETAVLGRIDEIVPFHPLPSDAMEKIARRTLDEAIENAQTHNRRILISDDIIPYIVKDRTSNDTERGGARDAKRNVRNLVIQELAHYLTYTKKEVPVIIYLKGRPRFKYTDVADPLNAHVAIMECHPANSGDTILKRLGAQINKPLINKGLYFPLDKPLQSYLQELVILIKKGYFQFYTHVDGETVTIKGV